MSWSREEVEATVATYLRMLCLELARQRYNKADYKRKLLPLLNGRTPGAVEMKHQNISAILLELRMGYIPGYKPLFNYQSLLRDVVVSRIAENHELESLMLQAVEQKAVVPDFTDVLAVRVDPPRARVVEDSGGMQESEQSRRGFKRDYLQLEARNRFLGDSGEKFIAEFERRRLHASGRKQLADRVEHVAQTQGDGLGYDVLSFEPDGQERFIEVKTTAFGAITPFYVSRNEKLFSEENHKQFVLARVHEFRSTPKFFELKGAISKTVRLDPVSFLARL